MARNLAREMSMGDLRAPALRPAGMAPGKCGAPIADLPEPAFWWKIAIAARWTPRGRRDLDFFGSPFRHEGS